MVFKIIFIDWFVHVKNNMDLLIDFLNVQEFNFKQTTYRKTQIKYLINSKQIKNCLQICCTSKVLWIFRKKNIKFQQNLQRHLSRTFPEGTYLVDVV